MAACSLDTGGVASSGANTLGPSPGGSDTTNATTESDPQVDSTNGDSDDASGSASGSADGTGPTTGTDGIAQLSLSGGPIYDFGLVPVSMLGAGTLTVTNIGNTDATGIASLELTPPFEYTGMTYPGAGGTCMETLGPGQSCTLDLAFRPQQLGIHDGTLTLAYDQGPDSIRALTGGGTGHSANLLVNPGGEDMGSPPPGWNDIELGEWAAGTPSTMVEAYEGSYCHYAAQGFPFAEYALFQDVDVAAWSHTIDQGLMRFDFVGWGRTYQFGNDQYRFVVRYLGVSGQPIDSWSIDWTLDAFWQMHGTQGTAPAGTRSIRIELGCVNYVPGTTRCDAYFDALSLQATYP
ncbi:MAG: hypothetical protein AAGF11_30550 [Myxococcota bacterium]